MLGESLAAWILVPAVAVVLATGLALLVERATSTRLPELRVPIGLCVAICLTLATFELGATGLAALFVAAVPAAIGLFLGRSELRAWRPGWLTLCWLAGYALHLAPVALAGAWTWTGYNFVNDTSIQLLLADHLAAHGAVLPDLRLESSAVENVRGYIENAYPLGSHALLATLAEAVPAPLSAAYQPFLAVTAASTAVALAHLARRAGLALAWSAACGVLAVGANLFYQYALQGNLKEVAFLMALATAAAAGRDLIGSARPERLALAVAAGFAAAFSVYSAAAAPYLLALGAGLAVGALVLRERASVKRLALTGGALMAGALLLALPALLSVARFNQIASGTFASAERAADLGHLLRPLELIQAAGVWLTGDYRGPVPGVRADITTGIAIVAVALGVVGLVAALRRREPGVPILVAATLVSAAYLLPRLSPYADGKVIALASPVLLVPAMLGAAALSKRWAPVGAGLAALVAVGVLWSDAFAYHAVKLAPTDRLDAIADVGRRLAGAPGLVLFNEPEEFAKNNQEGAPFNVSTEAVVPRQIELRNPQGFANRYFDFDEQRLAFVTSFPWIIKRRSPGASRPPVSFRFAYANHWYEAWRRRPGIEVVDHLGLGGADRRGAIPGCAEVLGLARIARPGERLIAAAVPAQLRLDTASARRSPGWVKHPYLAGRVITETPGTARGRARAPAAGVYEAWVAGSFGRTVEVRVDGRRVGHAGGVNNLGQWLPAGRARLPRGRHVITVTRPGGDLAPGDGYKGELGPVVLERADRRPPLVSVRPSEARRLCGRVWDWVELVRGG